jgi:hypothetical protein
MREIESPNQTEENEAYAQKNNFNNSKMPNQSKVSLPMVCELVIILRPPIQVQIMRRLMVCELVIILRPQILVGILGVCIEREKIKSKPKDKGS